MASKISELDPKARADPPVSDPKEEASLFGEDTDEEDDEHQKAEGERRLEEHRQKKEGKIKPPAKSIVTLDVKPWGDDTDMAQLEANVRAIKKDGLVWGLSKREPQGYGMEMLRINLVVEDEKVSVEDLREEIQEDEELVQSTDVAAMQKL